MTGRVDINNPISVEHIIKKTHSDDAIVSIESLRPTSTATDGPIHSSIMMAQSYRTRQAHAVPGVGTAVKRPSPTLSVKRNKAKRLIKERDSPRHVRVTAGGRIVPNNLPWLGSPQVPFIPMYRSDGPSHVPLALPNCAPYGPQLPSDFLAYSAYGKLIQWFDGRWHDIHYNGYGQPIYQMSPSNIPFPPTNVVFGYGVSSIVSPNFREYRTFS
jgi:hypothetical protein